MTTQHSTIGTTRTPRTTNPNRKSIQSGVSSGRKVAELLWRKAMAQCPPEVQNMLVLQMQLNRACDELDPEIHTTPDVILDWLKNATPEGETLLTGETAKKGQ